MTVPAQSNYFAVIKVVGVGGGGVNADGLAAIEGAGAGVDD